MGDMKHADPVILIIGHRFRTLVEAFHTANALVASELETAVQ